MNKRIEVTGRRSRIFLAHRAIALGWALKGSCKVCANRLFAIAGWLVPETQRFLVLRTGSHEHPRRIMKFAADVRTLLSPIVSLKVVAGALIVLALLGSLELVTRATAITTRPFGGDSAFQLGSQIEPAPAGEMQSEVIPRLQGNPKVPTASRTRQERSQSLKKEWLSEKVRGTSRSLERHPLVVLSLKRHRPVRSFANQIANQLRNTA